MKKVKIVVIDFRNEIPKSLMEEYEKEFFDLKRQEIKQEKEKESLNEVKNDPDESFLFIYEQKPKIPKREVKRLEVKSTRGTKFSDHQCEVCHKYLSSKNALKAHIELHFQPNNFKCKKCKKVFGYEHYFKIHKCIKDLTCPHCNFKSTLFCRLKVHVHNVHKLKMPDDNFSCDSCGAYFKLKRYLALHVLKCSTKSSIKKEAKYFCDCCDKKFVSKQQIRYHVLKHAIHQVECEVCQIKMKPRSLRFHMDCFHPKIIEKFDCKECFKVFQTTKLLKMHLKHHEKKFQCPYCSLKFSNQNYLNSHKIIHENPEMLQCKICGHQSTGKGNLKVHSRIHDKNYAKRLKCKLCSSVLKNEPSYRMHLWYKHSDKKIFHKNPEKLQCKICGHQSTNKENLKAHLRIHDKNRVKRFQCNLCDYKTDSRRNLDNHKRSHKKNEEKLKKHPNFIKCAKCPSVLKNEKIYKSHLRDKHDNKKIFQCDLCEGSCTAKQSIRYHIENKHLKIV